MSIDLAAMTPKALQKLIADATREQKRKKKRAPIARVRSKLTQQAKTEGYTIAELFGTATSGSTTATATKAVRRKAAKSTKAKAKIPPKYRNPANADETWTGRGHAPVWLRTYLEAGRSRDEFLIDK